MHVSAHALQLSFLLRCCKVAFSPVCTDVVDLLFSACPVPLRLSCEFIYEKILLLCVCTYCTFFCNIFAEWTCFIAFKCILFAMLSDQMVCNIKKELRENKLQHTENPMTSTQMLEKYLKLKQHYEVKGKQSKMKDIVDSFNEDVKTVINNPMNGLMHLAVKNEDCVDRALQAIQRIELRQCGQFIPVEGMNEEECKKAFLTHELRMKELKNEYFPIASASSEMTAEEMKRTKMAELRKRRNLQIKQAHQEEEEELIRLGYLADKGKRTEKARKKNSVEKNAVKPVRTLYDDTVTRAVALLKP